MAIRLLYGLTKEALRAMRRPELDDVARQLTSVGEDAAGQLGKKAQTEFNATREAVDKELYVRKARDELAKEIDDDIVQATWETGGWIPGTKNPAQFVPEPENIARGVGSLARREGGTELPEFTSSNLSKISREELGETGTYAQWMSRSSPIDDWWGRKVMTETQPGKYANITLESLNPFQREVYKTYSTLKNQADFPKELSHPGVLSDLLDEAGRVANVGELKAQIGGNASKYIADYWRKKGPMIKKEWDMFESGDVPHGRGFDWKGD